MDWTAAVGQEQPFNVPDLTLIGIRGNSRGSVFEIRVVAKPPGVGAKLGIALATIGEFPINGLRVRVDGTCGWFIWGGGKASDDPNFYQPLHVAHIAAYLPSVEPYLSLPPGYRFQIANGHEDVWFDPELLVGK